MRHSVRTQLVLWNILTLALLLGALGLIIRYTVASTIMASVDRDLYHRTQPPGGRPPPMRGGPPPPGQPDDRPGPAPANPDHPRRFDLNGHSLEITEEAPWDAQALTRAAQGQTVYTTVVSGGETLRVLTRPLPPDAPDRGVVQAMYPLADVSRALAGLDRALILLMPFALLCAGLAGYALTGRMLGRVRGMTQAAGRIGAHDLSQRLPVTGKDEFSALAATFNSLLGRLEEAFGRQARLMQQQRRFTADASHELKTPLTIIKGNAGLALTGSPTEAQYRQSLGEIEAASETMARLVQDLLLLARSDDGQFGRNPIEMLAREVLERAAARLPRVPSAPIRLQIADEGLSLTGNEDELVRLFANLLENATRHTPIDGCITVTARRKGENVVIQVTDTGGGIAPEHLPHLGERFYRVDSARSRPDGGTGLGLSICKSIADAHGGTLTVESALGKGTVVTVTLP